MMRGFAVLALIVASATGCSKSSTTCNASNCEGCCDATGVCQLPTAIACGVNGAACVACEAADVCNALGMCVPPGATTGTTTSVSGTSGSGTTGASVAATVGATFGTLSNSASSSSSGSSSSGTSTVSSSSGSTGSSGSSGFMPPLDGGYYIYADGGGFCDFGAPQGGSCNPECNVGFHCEGGQCILNGNTGPLEVTLRWNQPVDLDLHVVEPGGCEVYYGNRSCTSGSLDLDSNPACNIDNVDTENVIFVDGGPTPPSGTYTVRVDDYDECTPPGQVILPFEVIVRVNGVTSHYCGEFVPGVINPATGIPWEGDQGSMGAGMTIVNFTY